MELKGLYKGGKPIKSIKPSDFTERECNVFIKEIDKNINIVKKEKKIEFDEAKKIYFDQEEEIKDKYNTCMEVKVQVDLLKNKNWRVLDPDMSGEQRELHLTSEVPCPH